MGAKHSPKNMFAGENFEKLVYEKTILRSKEKNSS